MSKNRTHKITILAALSAVMFVAADWPQFRGPQGAGVSSDVGLPETWAADENIVWKTALPGFGASSPIVLGDKIFLTCYSGYGLDENDPGDQANLQQQVWCINRADGTKLWGKGTLARPPMAGYDEGQVELHGYASATPVTDGQAVYVFFGRSGVLAYSLSGEPLWRTFVGDEIHKWGSATSPILHENLVIVNASVESKSIVSLDKSTGEEVWRVPGIEASWSTPMVVDVPNGEPELVVSFKGKILGLDPKTGQELWQCRGVEDYTCPAVIANEGVVYVTGGRKPQCFAVRAGGRGDVSDTHVLWEIRETPKVPTPVYHDGYLYWFERLGVAVCVNAQTGEVVYEERLDVKGSSGDKVYASPVLADGKLYGVTREDGTIALAAGPEFNELARNYLGDTSIFNATPAVNNGQLLIRSDRFLYCIGK